MCVILFSPSQKHRPTAEILRACETANPHGAGIAWVEKQRGVVMWEKGITADQVIEWLPDIPGPVVIHFRIASVGEVSDRLCHPFPISKSASLAVHGKASRGVLFHNGTWCEWEDKLLETALAVDEDLPDGPWSDSRAAAWICARLGRKAITELEMSGRYAVLTPRGGAFLYGNWTPMAGISYSNLYWRAHLPGTHFRRPVTLRLQDLECGDECDE